MMMKDRNTFLAFTCLGFGLWQKTSIKIAEVVRSSHLVLKKSRALPLYEAVRSKETRIYVKQTKWNVFKLSIL
jgi:hypothetical protein